MDSNVMTLRGIRSRNWWTGLYHARVHLLLILLTLYSGEIRRCALPYLNQQGIARPTNATVQAGQASRKMASALSTYQTEHFVFWWSTQDTVHRIQGSSGADSGGVPKLVRVAAEGLEKAWRGYVDTLNYLPPKAASTSAFWQEPVPAGKYPVEFCNIAAAMGIDTSAFFGVAYPDGSQGRSALMLASNLQRFGWWQMQMDLNNRYFTMDYSVNWRETIRATAAHELFHAVQFNYERALNAHGFFEASAIAMESRMVPESRDYLQYARRLVELQSLVPFPAGVGEYAYPQGWFVRTMMMDLGIDVVRGVWESRKATAVNPPSFLSTMRQVLPGYSGGSFDSLLIHQAMRVALTGMRSAWIAPQLPLFSDGSFFPTLAGVLTASESMKSLALDLGAIQVLIDTLAPTEDRLLVWVPDEGVVMGHAANTATGTTVSWHQGSVRYSSTDAARSAWVFANPGNPAALRPSATREASISHYRIISAPVRTAVSGGQKMTWNSPDGLVLSGTSNSSTQSTLLLHLDVWKPSAGKDRFAAQVAGNTSGHAIVLEDADHVLSLSGATLRWDGKPIVTAFQGVGDGVWKPVEISGNVLFLGDLDLSQPIRILVNNTGSTRPVSSVPRPNPSRQSDPIHFPILGATGSENLTILAADGGIVRLLHPDPSETEVIWDLRNRENRKVRPGVYTYIWRSVEGASHGQLLVAE